MIYFVETVFKPLFCEIRYLVYVWTTPTVYALIFTVTNKPRRAGYAVFTCIMYNVKCIILVTIINKINQSIKHMNCICMIRFSSHITML